jgi:hypothetical protein
MVNQVCVKLGIFLQMFLFVTHALQIWQTYSQNPISLANKFKETMLCKIGEFNLILDCEIHPQSCYDLHSTMPLSHQLLCFSETNQNFGDDHVQLLLYTQMIIPIIV